MDPYDLATFTTDLKVVLPLLITQFTVTPEEQNHACSSLGKKGVWLPTIIETFFQLVKDNYTFIQNKVTKKKAIWKDIAIKLTNKVQYLSYILKLYKKEGSSLRKSFGRLNGDGS